MAVARGVLPGTRLCLGASTTTAQAANQALRCRSYGSSRGGEGAPRKPDLMRRLRMAAFRDWYSADGKILTTAENQSFLRTHNIAVDNGRACRIREPNDARKVLAKYGIMPAFLNQHLVHPYQLEFLDPRGHPLAETKRAAYLEKHDTQPLWTIITVMSAQDKAIVRSRAQRRLTASLCSGLERAGYDKFGSGQGKRIYGTAWFALQEALKFMNMPPGEEVGDAMVMMLEAAMQQQEDQSSTSGRPRNNDWERGDSQRSHQPRREWNDRGQKGKERHEPRRNYWDRQEDDRTHQPKRQANKRSHQSDLAPLSDMLSAKAHGTGNRRGSNQPRRQDTRRTADPSEIKFSDAFHSKR